MDFNTFFGDISFSCRLQLESANMDCNVNFNSICMINASNNLYFIIESLGNILVYNFDELRMELLFYDPKR
jgi:hypothetical protein